MTELGRKARSKDFYLSDNKIIRGFLDRGKLLADRVVQEKEINPLLQETQKNYEDRETLRKMRVDLRSQYKGETPTFEEAFQFNADWMVRDVFLKHHFCATRYVRVWNENRSELSFSEKFFKGWFATLYIPTFDHNVKVDKNDGVDAEQLSYLVWADIFVSDDMQFVPRVFHLLFPNGDKKLMTSQEFIKYLETLA